VLLTELSEPNFLIGSLALSTETLLDREQNTSLTDQPNGTDIANETHETNPDEEGLKNKDEEE
jgi:hypothetical protein